MRWTYLFSVRGLGLGVVLVCALVGCGPIRGADELPPGSRDIEAVFARAAQGAPLRYVALGGSITQAGKGWIGDWLRQQFPLSTVYVQNSGMSGTGSALGVFRLERDVLAFQPDLVLVEFVVNDGGLKDDEATLYFESLIVRLKKMSHPPAIIFVIAGAESGLNKERHLAIARHYGLFTIDLDAKLHDYLAANNVAWSTLIKDKVHPNDKGNAFYSQWLTERLQPLADAAKKMNLDDTRLPEPRPLPQPVSAEPLILDGRMVLLRQELPWTEAVIPGWWNMFFQGTIAAKDPDTVLRFPFRGSAIGLLYTMDLSYGSFYASVDGGFPEQILTNSRHGYNFQVFAHGLPPCEHVLTVVLPQKETPNGAFITNGEVHLGYALVGGETKAVGNLAPQGPFTTDALRRLSFVPVPARDYVWIGPFEGAAPPSSDAHPSPDLETVFPPEAAAIAGNFSVPYPTQEGKAALKWQPLRGDDPFVDLVPLTGEKDRGVVYAATRVNAEQAGTFILRVTVDYFAEIWVDGKLIKTMSEGHGGPHSPLLIPVDLKRGWNELLLKVHAGSSGCSFSAAIGTVGSSISADLPLSAPAR